jgi:hypothetical protein
MIEHFAWIKTVVGWLSSFLSKWKWKPRVKVYIHPMGKPVWVTAPQPNGQIYMQVILQARVNHNCPHGLMIVDTFPEGTTPIVTGMRSFRIPPYTIIEEHLSNIVMPVVGKEGKDWVGKLVLIDHERRRHKTEKIHFMWVGQNAQVGTSKSNSK